jgi:hypothetical protein
MIHDAMISNEAKKQRSKAAKKQSSKAAKAKTYTSFVGLP